MKRMWAVLILLVLMLAACGFGISHTRKVTSEMTQTVSSAKQAQERGDTAAAYRLSKKAVTDWQNAHRVLCVFMVHSQLAELDQTLSVLPELCRNGAEDSFLSECDRGLMLISSLNESEIPNVENIF